MDLSWDHSWRHVRNRSEKEETMGHFCRNRRGKTARQWSHPFGKAFSVVNRVNVSKPQKSCPKREVRRNQVNGAHELPKEQLLGGLGELWGDFGRHRYFVVC